MIAHSAAVRLIEGERLYLRELRLSDVNETYRRWVNDSAVMAFLETRFAPVSMNDLRAYVAEKSADPDNLLCAIVLNGDDRHVGNIKLGPVNWTHRFGDIGILIGEKDCWGKGYAAECIRLIGRYAFDALDLHKLTAGCYATHRASIRAFEKAGFAQEGCRRKQYLCNGEYVDLVLFGLTRETWTAQISC